jgi:hypothetical protein
MNKSKLKEFISYHWAYIFYFCVFIFYSVFMYQCGARHAKKASVEVKRDTITRVISDIAPRMDTIIPLYTYKYIVKHKRDTIRTFTQVQMQWLFIVYHLMALLTKGHEVVKVIRQVLNLSPILPFHKRNDMMHVFRRSYNSFLLT